MCIANAPFALARNLILNFIGQFATTNLFAKFLFQLTIPPCCHSNT